MKNIIITILVVIILALVLVLSGVIKLNFNMQFGNKNINSTNNIEASDTKEEATKGKPKSDSSAQSQARPGQTQTQETSADQQGESKESDSSADNSNEDSKDKAPLNVDVNSSVNPNLSLQLSPGAYSDADTQNNTQGQQSENQTPSAIFDTADFHCKPPLTEAYALRGYSHDYSWYGAQDVDVKVETVYAPEVYKNWSECKEDPLAWTDNKTARILKVTNNEKHKVVRIGFAESKEIKMSLSTFFDVYDTSGQKTDNILGPKESLYLVPKNDLRFSGTKAGPHLIKIFIKSDYIKGKQIKFTFPANKDKTRIVHIDSKLPCVKGGQAGTWRYKYEISAQVGEDIYTSNAKVLSKYCQAGQ